MLYAPAPGPPHTSLGAALSWVVGGLVLLIAAFYSSGIIGVYLILLGVFTSVVGGACVAKLYPEEFVVKARDLEERLLGQRRTRYER